MSEKRQKLQEALCRYISETLAYFDTVRDFFERSSDWKSERETELKMIKDIKERADKGTKAEKELASVLKKTLGGLEELSCFLDALEKLAVTSFVFMENQVFHLPKGIGLYHVQVVIIAARQVCHLLLEFKRDANAFFLPKLQNVGVLLYQLDKYIQTTQIILDKLDKSSFSEFDPKMNMNTVVDLDVDLSEGDVQRMFSHIDQLDKIRNNHDFRMVFLFQEEEKCSCFISEFNERVPEMLQFLKELEDRCVQLDRMNKGAKISSVAGSSVGAVGGVLSIAGLALLPFTAGASLGLIMGGSVMGVTSTANSLVTTATEIIVNRKHQQKAKEVFKNFMDDVQVLQGCLEEVAKRETSNIDMAVGVGKVLWKARAVYKGIDAAVDAYVALKTFKNKNVTAGAGKVVAQEGKAVGNVSKVASDVPDIGQAALKGPLALSKSTRHALIVTNALFVGMDIFFICKDSISLANGSETEFSQFIRARAALWSSEIESWQKIHDSLCKGLPKSEENKAYLEVEVKKQRETERKNRKRGSR